MVKIGKISPIFFFALLYLITGLILLLTSVQVSPVPLHAAAIGALSILSYYGLSKRKRWALYLASFVSLPSIAFGCVTAYALSNLLTSGFMEYLLLSAIMLYVVFHCFSIILLVSNREKFR
jgi:hypothetical protein